MHVLHNLQLGSINHRTSMPLGCPCSGAQILYGHKPAHTLGARGGVEGASGGFPVSEPLPTGLVRIYIVTKVVTSLVQCKCHAGNLAIQCVRALGGAQYVAKTLASDAHSWALTLTCAYIGETDSARPLQD